VTQPGLYPATTRQAIQAMLEEQPLPLRGNARPQHNPQSAEPRGIE